MAHVIQWLPRKAVLTDAILSAIYTIGGECHVVQILSLL
jgi:hypothetical protein